MLVVRSGVPCGEMEVCGDVSRPGLRSEADQAQRMTVGLPQVGGWLVQTDPAKVAGIKPYIRW